MSGYFYIFEVWRRMLIQDPPHHLRRPQRFFFSSEREREHPLPELFPMRRGDVVSVSAVNIDEGIVLHHPAPSHPRNLLGEGAPISTLAAKVLVQALVLEVVKLRPR